MKICIVSGKNEGTKLSFHIQYANLDENNIKNVLNKDSKQKQTYITGKICFFM